MSKLIVFGEFKQSIMEIRYALWQRDFEGAVKELDELSDRMFSA